MTRKQAMEAILEHLREAVKEGAPVVHMSALVTDDDTTTLEDVVRIAAGEAKAAK